MVTRVCKFCAEPIKGRLDKKYCDDACRSAFNNKLNCDQTNRMRNINNVLRRNRRILEDIYSCEKASKPRISGKKIQELGFTFQFYTHTRVSTRGSLYYYCYEYGYMPLKNDNLLLVKMQDE